MTIHTLSRPSVGDVIGALGGQASDKLSSHVHAKDQPTSALSHHRKSSPAIIRAIPEDRSRGPLEGPGDRLRPARGWSTV